MFDISFTGELVRDEEEGETRHLGIMTLGQTTEGFDASLSFWSEGEYEKQWLEGAKRLLEPGSRSAFITDMTNPTTASFIQWWPAWRVNDLIIFHCQTLFIGVKEGSEAYHPWAARFSLENPYAAVANRDEGHTEECRKTGVCRRPKIGARSDTKVDLCVSEWCVYLEEIREFMDRRTKNRAQ
jgi:hypothetical protein